MTKVLTVYRKHPCVKCDMTIRYGKRLGYKVVIEELFDDNGELNTVPASYVNQFNYHTAPIVVLSEDGVLIDKWCDFQILKLNEYAPQK